MADIRSNINVNIDTSNALASIKQLQGQISAFHSSLRNSGSAANQAVSQNLTKNLVNSINATKQFSASLTTVSNRTQAFTSALEKNKFSLGQYFRYGAATTKTFGKVFRKEFDTIERVAGERVKTMQTQFITLGKNANGAFESIKVRPLTLDMQNLGTQVAMTVQKQQLFNQLLSQGSTNLLNFGKNTQWAGRQLMVGLTIPLSLLGSAAMKTFSEMEEQAIRFKRVYGELFTTESETNAMIQELDTLARSFTKYGIAIADTMSLAADAAAMGKMGADLSAQVSEATRLAVLGGVEQSEALQTTISITNAFGTAAEELAGKIDFLNAVENQTVTSIEDLTVAIPKAGPVIKELGGDVEDLAFFLTAMKEGGINASEGANALKSGLARMINPTRAATEFLSQFNININEIVEGNAGNIKGAVLELATALDTLDPLNKSRAIEELFGRFQFARISTLFNNVVAEGNQAQRVLQLTAATSEELAILSERELKRVEDSPLYKFQKAVEDVQKALMPLGQQFMELITPILQFATKLLEGFNNLDGGVKKFITGAIAALGLVAPVALMTFGLFANGIANLIKGFGLVRGLFLKVAYAGTGLSSQLSYMTQEHLEAASAANALGSTHSNLMNIFTAETSAVMNLINAYNQATVAIQRNNVAAGTRATKGTGGSMKLASGIVSVPGPKGAGDIVPAMLSPGEAVIPADAAKKFGPLIRGIVNDDLPGFNQGLVPAYTNAVALLGTGANQALKGGGANAMSLSQDFASNPGINAPIVRAVAEEMGATNNKQIMQMLQNDPNLREFAQDIGTGVSREIAKAGAKSGGKVTDPQLAQIYQKVAQAEAKKRGGAYAKATKPYFEQLTTFEDSTIQRRSSSTGKLRSIGRAKLLEDKVSYRAMNYNPLAEELGIDSQKRVKAHVTDRKMINLSTIGGKLSAQAKAARVRIEKGITEVYDSVSTGVNKASQSRSPSRKAKQAGKNIADGAIQGIKDGAKGAKAAGSQVGQQVVSGAAGTADKKLIRQQRAQRRAQIGGRAFGALGTASMVAGMGSMMGGPVGEISSKLMGPLMAASALAGILPMLTNPIGLVVAGLAAAVGGFLYLKKVMKDSTEAGREAAKAMTLTSSELEELAKQSGKVSSSGIADRRRQDQLSGGEAVKREFGQTFMDSAVGKSFLDQAEKRISGGASSQEIAKTFSNDLSYAIMQGAITQDQAMSIASELGAKLQDFTISSKIQGDLVALYGPDGSNLLTDPLRIATQVQQGQTRQQVAAYENFESTRQANRSQTSGAGINVGAGALMAVAGGLMAVVPGLQVLGGLMIAGGVATMTGASIAENLADAKENNKAAGVAVQLGAEQLSQNQGLLDSLEQQYDSQIAQLESKRQAATTDEEVLAVEEQINAKMAERSEALTKLKGQNKEIFESLIAQAEAMGPSFNDAINLAIDERFKDASGAMKAAAELAKESLGGLEAGDFKATLSVGLASGEFDPITITNLINANAADGAIESKFTMLIASQGTAEANQVIQLLAASGVGTASYPVFIDLMAKNPAEFEDKMNALVQINQLDTEYGVEVDLEAVGVEAIEKSATYLKDIEGLPPKVTKEILTKFVEDSPGMDAETKSRINELLGNWDEFTKGTNIATFDVITNFMVGSTAGLEAYALSTYFANNPLEKQLVDIGAVQSSSFVSRAMASLFGTPYNGSGDGKETDPPTTNTGGSSADPIGDILKKLKQVRDFAINAAGGIDALKNAIKGVDFMGIQQKLTFAGYGQDFISAINAMDAETRKKFVSIENGALKVTAAGKALAQAYSEVKLGEFQASLVSGLSDVNKQIQAMNILQSRGLSNAEAFDIVKDSSLAYAIATSDTTEEVDELIKAFGKLQDAQDKLNNSTVAGMEGTLGTAFGNIREFFAAQEEAVNLAFNANTAGDSSILSNAQNDIAALQYVSDDLNYALDQIKEKEDEINKRYDKRVDALEKVSEINKDIISQEKGQLDIAQALASGDIAAAAKAVQEYRAEEASRAQAKAKDLLGQARQNELDAVTAENGKTRLQLETELKDITKQIAEIEESRLEPAQERIRIATVARDIALEAIGTDGYLGKTKDEWAAVENAIRLAKVESEDYKKAIEDALTLIPKLRDAYDGNTGAGSQSDGPQLTAEQQAAIDKIKSNRAAVRTSEGTTAADKKMMQENVALIKMLDAAGINRSLFMSGGGKVPKYYAAGGFARGTDSIPAMLTPGEFVVRKYAVDKFGADKLKAINSGAYNGGNMYNSYAVNVNVKSDANPDQIARAVMTQIKSVESQRMRSNRF